MLCDIMRLPMWHESSECLLRPLPSRVQGFVWTGMQANLPGEQCTRMHANLRVELEKLVLCKLHLHVLVALRVRPRGLVRSSRGEEEHENSCGRARGRAWEYQRDEKVCEYQLKSSMGTCASVQGVCTHHGSSQDKVELGSRDLRAGLGGLRQLDAQPPVDIAQLRAPRRGP